jgi:hypothetical protein
VVVGWHANPVINDLDLEDLSEREVHNTQLSLGMPDDVRKCFLNDAVGSDFDGGRQGWQPLRRFN